MPTTEPLYTLMLLTDSTTIAVHADSLAKTVNSPSLFAELAPFVPLLQTLLWVVLIIVGVVVFYGQLQSLFAAIQRRIETGSSFQAGPLKLGEDFQGDIRPPKDSSPSRQPLEYKILNTLWTKQVNRWPDHSHMFTFRINFYSHEFLPFREAGNKLIGEQLIAETDTGQFYLTPQGFEYCKTRHEEFPPEQWWPEEQINPDNLRKALET